MRHEIGPIRKTNMNNLCTKAEGAVKYVEEIDVNVNQRR